MRLSDRLHGYICKVPYCDMGAFKEQRGIKKHYRDRSKHTVEQLLQANVAVQTLTGLPKEDIAAAREWWLKKGVIVEVEAEEDDDDYDADDDEFTAD